MVCNIFPYDSIFGISIGVILMGYFAMCFFTFRDDCRGIICICLHLFYNLVLRFFALVPTLVSPHALPCFAFSCRDGLRKRGEVCRRGILMDIKWRESWGLISHYTFDLHCFPSLLIDWLTILCPNEYQLTNALKLSLFLCRQMRGLWRCDIRFGPPINTLHYITFIFQIVSQMSLRNEYIDGTI